jgi:hypothetical protein
MDHRVRLDEITISSARKRKPFKPFTSAVSAAALVGLYVGMLSILIERF